MTFNEELKQLRDKYHQDRETVYKKYMTPEDYELYETLCTEDETDEPDNKIYDDSYMKRKMRRLKEITEIFKKYNINS